MEMDELSSRISTTLQDISGVCLAYLFGSQVDATDGPLSDVDIGVLVERSLYASHLQALLAHELGKIFQPFHVDIVLLHSAPIELAYSIISQGICLFQRDTLTRVEFEAGVLSRYGDYLPVLRAHRQAIFEEGGDDNRVQRYREALGRTQRALSQTKAP